MAGEICEATWGLLGDDMFGSETGGFAPVTTWSTLDIADFGREIGVRKGGLEVSGGFLVAIFRCAYKNRGVQLKPQGCRPRFRPSQEQKPIQESPFS